MGRVMGQNPLNLENRSERLNLRCTPGIKLLLKEFANNPDAYRGFQQHFLGMTEMDILENALILLARISLMPAIIKKSFCGTIPDNYYSSQVIDPDKDQDRKARKIKDYNQ